MRRWIRCWCRDQQHKRFFPLIDWINPVSTLLAVLVGAGLSYWSTTYLDRRKDKDIRLGQAYALMFQVQSMTDDLVKLARQIALARQSAPQEAAGVPLWMILDDIVGYTEREAITPESLALVAVTKDVELLVGIQEVEAAHRIYLDCFARMAELRRNLESTGLQSSAHGNCVTYVASQEDYPRVAPILIRLEQLSQELEVRLPEATQHARVISAKIGPLLKTHFRFEHFVSLVIDDAAGNAQPPGS